MTSGRASNAEPKDLPRLGPLDIEAFASPRLFPLTLDPTGDQVRLVGLREPQYSMASFLDERVLAEAGPGTIAPFEILEAAARTLRGESDFIFHIGHVGSTLLSRLLGASDKVFSLREPARFSNPSQPIRRRLTVRHWAARGFGPPLSHGLGGWSRRPSLKATSFTNDLAPLLMEGAHSARALLMFVPPADYMAGVLSGEGTRGEMMALAPFRLARLHRRLGGQVWRLADMDEGEIAAMSLELAGICYSRRHRYALSRPLSLWFDFEDHLARPAAGLATALKHLHGGAFESEVAALLALPDVGRYSKAPEFAYDASLRRRVLNQAKDQHRSALDRGGAWLNAAGRAHSLIVKAAAAAPEAPRIG